MLEKEIKKYQTLNKLADSYGIVILGGTEDKNIPLSELIQAFDLNAKLYNRSISNLSINKALAVYDNCIAGLKPESVLLHIGAADLDFFTQDSSSFDQKYRDLIRHIKSLDKECHIAIISFTNPDNSSDFLEMNKHLKYIAESEQCEFGDISTKRVWNPMETKNVISLISSLNLFTPLKTKLPLYDLIKILFCSNSLCTD